MRFAASSSISLSGGGALTCHLDDLVLAPEGALDGVGGGEAGSVHVDLDATQHVHPSAEDFDVPLRCVCKCTSRCLTGFVEFRNRQAQTDITEEVKVRVCVFCGSSIFV